LIFDDWKGVNEALDDGSFAAGTHQILISNLPQIGQTWRGIQAQKIFKPLLQLYGKPVNAKLPAAFQSLTNPLPAALNILSLENWGQNEVLLRLEHIFEPSTTRDQPVLKLPDLTQFLTPYTFKKCKLVNLVGQELKLEEKENNSDSDSCRNLTLEPFEIKTFLLSW
jgi:hypothetical protein